VCLPGPPDTGRFTPTQWAALPGDDPRRTHRTVVVDPPDDHGHHDTLIDATTRAGMDPAQWHQVWDLNRALSQPNGRPLASPSLIHPGDVLAIPHTDLADQPPHPNERPAPPDRTGRRDRTPRLPHRTHRRCSPLGRPRPAATAPTSC
jgi:hypothetical protein